MVVLTANQLKAWDEYTVQHEPVPFIDLMERAAQACVDWIIEHQFDLDRRFVLFCGRGNNGGDGLAISRMLHLQGYTVLTYILAGDTGTEGFQTNLARLQALPVEIVFAQTAAEISSFDDNDVLVDALFGSGLNKPLEGTPLLLARHINRHGQTIISIDLPSGLFADNTTATYDAVKATHTLTFQVFKKALLVAENAAFIGKVHILDIGLHNDFIKGGEWNEHVIDNAVIKSIYKPRGRFSHKGSHGHALLIGGSYGSIGAITLSTNACLRSGVGLVTTYIPSCGYTIMQTAAPEAMVITGDEEHLLAGTPAGLEKYNALGIGPGMGTAVATQQMVRDILSSAKQPLIIDADGLNCLALQDGTVHMLPAGSVLTPHPKEFERLFGKTANEFERLELARRKSVELKVVIVLKGHHTYIALPDGTGYFNNNGNAGMAKGGSGDVLTGIIAGLLAQNYQSGEAAILGVFLHGLAGDLAAKELSEEGMTAGDLISFLPKAFLRVAQF